jgi:hypothetical protein
MSGYSAGPSWCRWRGPQVPAQHSGQLLYLVQSVLSLQVGRGLVHSAQKPTVAGKAMAAPDKATTIAPIFKTDFMRLLQCNAS